MNRNTRLIVFCIGLLAIVSVSFAQETYDLKRKAKVGDVQLFQASADIDLGGSKATFTSKVSEKIVGMHQSGGFVVESVQSEMLLMLGENNIDVEDTKPRQTVYAPYGEIIEIRDEGVDADAYRLVNLGVFRAPESPVKVGDSWSFDFPANDKTGMVAARVDYVVEAFEEIEGYKALRINVDYTETEGAEPAQSKGQMWINVEDGTLVKAEQTFTNAPLPNMPGPFNAVVKITRLK